MDAPKDSFGHQSSNWPQVVGIFNQVLDVLYCLFPNLPLPHPLVRDLEPAILGLAEALATVAPAASAPISAIQCTASLLANEGAVDRLTGRLKQLGDRLPVNRPAASEPHLQVHPDALLALAPRPAPSTAWNVAGGFVAAEGLRLLSVHRIDPNQPDLLEAYRALLLTGLIQSGLFERCRAHLYCELIL
ncbi:unnamed protein product [Protopolystoma xenopodis]|uniref:Uncharacterized protein n=1 Tax=Protopolystoma xenopodis TaxID=117903 RepID=A0A3S5AZE5_9PLAT|nr:unnamed protein product [Protopolystoma xenopodis]